MNNDLKYQREAPTVTVFLFAYNQEAFIRQACESLLMQDYSPLTIIFSDDCSTDNTFQIMSEIKENYKGCHTLKLNKNSENIGLIPHVNLSHQLVNTDLTIAAAGDDISEPYRVREIIKAYRCAVNEPTSLYSSVRNMFENGTLGKINIPPIQNLKDSISKYATSSALIIGASHAWHRCVFDQFGDISELKAFEDLVLAYRSSLLNGLVYIDKPLVKYRLGVGISEAGKYDQIDLRDQNTHKKLLLREINIMLPVLNQRLQDSKNFNVKKEIIDIIQKKIYEYQIKNYFLQEKKNYLSLLRMSLNLSLLPFLIKMFIKKLRGKL